MKLRATFETHVFINADGLISIRQIYSDGDDAIVVLSRHQSSLVGAELSRLAGDDANWPDGELVEGD
jgi:hypothetical protein